jgi:hypothetical protein
MYETMVAWETMDADPDLEPFMRDFAESSLPDGARVDLELFEQRRFGNGVVFLRYRAKA